MVVTPTGSCGRAMTLEFQEHEMADTFFRRLDEEGEAAETEVTGNSSIIVNTLRVYGSFYAVAIVLFEFLRRRYPRLYSIRSWVPEQECELAKVKYQGLFSWFWKVYQVSDKDIFEQCGMDNLCFLRALRFCRHLAVVGVINALWLLPIYRTAKESPETSSVTDDLDRFTLANIPSSSVRFFATVLAAYVMVLYTMYLLSKEFQWYTYWRHKFLSQRVPRNYAVYVYGIPKEFRSSYKLAAYFRSCSSETAVLEAHVAMDTPQLEKLQAEREGIINRLEHLDGVEKRRRGKKIRAIKGLKIMEKEELVRSLEERLGEINHEVPRRIKEVMATNDRFRSRLTKLRSTKDLLGGIDMEEGSHGNDKPYFLSEPTIDENATMDFQEMTTDLRSTFARDNTCDTILMNTGENESESPSQSEMRQFGDNVIAEDEEEKDEEYHTLDNVNEPQGNMNESLTSVSYPEVFDSSDRAFLSLFFPDSESLLPGSSYRRENSLPTSITTRQHAIPDSNGSRLVIPPDNEVPSSLSLVDHVEDDVEAQKNGPEMYEYEEDAEDSESDSEAATGELVFRDAALKGSNRPGLGSRASSASNSSQGSRSAISAIARTTNELKHGITKGTKTAGMTLKKGTQFTKDTLTKGGKLAGKTIAAGSRTATTTVMKAAKDIKVDRLVHHAGNFVPMVLNRGEGEPRAGGFVVFTNLYTAQTALQMVHHAVPYTMEVQEAPSPGDIFWRNVGMKPRKRRLGRLYSVGASAFLCFFWSIPTAFIASLTSVSTIKEEIPRLGALVDKYPWFEEVLFQLAPMLLLFLNEVLLPEFLKVFATWEGHVSSAVLEASLFLKLSAFMIIQTFFVSAISGSIYAELTNMIKNPEEIIDLLSTSLPSQSAYFMQIMFAATFLLQAIELLRVYPLACALARRFIGPNATAKERKKPWMYIYTLESPPEFWHAETFAQIQILYVMVLLVYAVIAPFTACALLFCFILLEAGYRYQFIHNYPKAFDTGGKLWFTFVQFVLASLLIAELTLAGLLALKQSRFAGPAVGPLIVITILFILFINSRHSHVMKFLPTRDCVEIDQANAKAGLTDFSFCKGEYLQPSLKKFRDDPEYEDSDDD